MLNRGREKNGTGQITKETKAANEQTLGIIEQISWIEYNINASYGLVTIYHWEPRQMLAPLLTGEQR